MCLFPFSHSHLKNKLCPLKDSAILPQNYLIFNISMYIWFQFLKRSYPSMCLEERGNRQNLPNEELNIELNIEKWNSFFLHPQLFLFVSFALWPHLALLKIFS